MIIRVMVVSEHAGLRSRIAAILRQWPDFDVPALCRDSYDALYSARAFLPHVALVDEDPSLLDCPGLVSALKRWSPATRTLVLASSPAGPAVLASIAAGAAGYLLKDRDDNVIPAVVWVHQGGLLVSPDVARRAFESAPGGKPPPAAAPGITRGDLELLARIGRGLSDKEIAAELRLKNGTVRNRVSSLLRRTGLKSRTEAALFARGAGIAAGGREPGTGP
jgi:DNA-binding NarL/FixJ family response regulator